ncbi:MAG: LEA type 2 family protein [Pseudomonadota bacterium]|nr:LEA type 2 family protein [Pseudomonadota bacterium]
MLILARLLLFAFTAWAASCSLFAPKFARPTVTVSGVEMAGGNVLQQNFLIRFNVQNPNDRALPVTGLHAELNVLGERVASGVSNRGFVVPAHGESQFDMSVTANLVLALLKLSQKTDRYSGSIDYDLTGAASIDLPFMHDLPFHQSGSFSLRGPP